MNPNILLRPSTLVACAAFLVAAASSIPVSGQPAAAGGTRTKILYNNGTISTQVLPATPPAGTSGPGLELTPVEYWYGSGAPALMGAGARGGGAGRGGPPAAAAAAGAAGAAGPALRGAGNAPMLNAEEIVKHALVSMDIPAIANQVGNLRAADGFEANVYATAPVANYPAAIAAAPDGTVYLGVDGNGAQGQLPVGQVGRILRLRDSNGDGVADEAKMFVPAVNGVRGLIWDHDRLIALHAPYISAYIDRNGDGVVDEEQILIRGSGRSTAVQRVDHGYNGIEIGIDGWIYIALGDEGFYNAEGTDGRAIQLRGGGVVRFRRDGSGLEVWAYGTRNIYGIAVGPLLDVIARDNTNDGGGWNVRMHYFTGYENHGYPSLFINYQDEIVQPLVDLGGGSGVGGLWLDEPGIPAAWNDVAVTGDYGRTGYYAQNITERNGATVRIANEQLITMTQPIDLDVDANSVIYASGWGGGGFTYMGPDHGYLARIAPKGFKPEPLPDFERLGNVALVGLLESPSYKRRLEAQHALLRRSGIAQEITPLLQNLASDKSKKLHYRVAAVFTLKQAVGAASHSFLGNLASDNTIAAWAIRAMADNVDQAKTIPVNVVLGGLKSTDPRTKLESIVALIRADATTQIPAIQPLLVDPDPVISHTAFQAFRRLNASDASFAILDDRSASEPLRAAALRVLQTFHEAKVVDGLVTRLGRETDAARQEGIITALGRLYNTEAEWNGDWWSTRPQNVGPYFSPATWSESAKIGAALDRALQTANTAETVAIGRAYTKFGIPAGDAVAKFISAADIEPALIPLLTERFAVAPEVPANAVPILIKAASTATTSAANRAQAVQALLKTDSAQAWNAILPALASMQQPAAAAVGPAGGGRGGAGGGGGRGGAAAPAVVPVTIPNLTANQQTALGNLTAAVVPQSQAATAAREALIPATYAEPRDPAALAAKVEALRAAELALAMGYANAFEAIQTSADKLSPMQTVVVARQGNRGLAVGAAVAPAAAGRGGAAGARGGAAGGARGGAGGRGGGRGGGALSSDQLLAAVGDSPRLNQFYRVFIDQAAKMDGEQSQLADSVLLALAGKRVGPVEGRQAAAAAIENGWRDPKRKMQILSAAISSRDTSRAMQIVESMNDADADVAQTARFAVQQLGIDAEGIRVQARLPRISTMQVEQVLNEVANSTGDVQRGQQLVNELSCTACHTFNAADAPKGPFLGGIAAKFPVRRDLAEQIISPNKQVAQGFLGNHLVLRDGTELDAFVVTEAADALTVRTPAGVESRVLKSNITTREQKAQSLMPDGLVAGLSIRDFASLVDYLQSLAAQQP